MAQETTDRGHKAAGDILRAQNKRDEALTAYEKSLQLNPQQEDVLSLVCDLITPDIHKLRSAGGQFRFLISDMFLTISCL